MTNNNTEVQKTYFSWNPADYSDYAPLIIGKGSIGGKGRSLLFARQVLKESNDEALESITIPPSRFLSVEIFEDFISHLNNPEILESGVPEDIEKVFLQMPLPTGIREDLAAFLSNMRDPIAIRSSSLLEDCLKHSFAGKYMSSFLPNDDASLEVRIQAVEEQIKRVYARIYFPNASSYRKKHGLGNDLMGIAAMRVSGKWRGDYYYPTTAGVGLSYNSRRWSTRIRQEDGIIRLVFGLGTMSTKRGYARTFSLTNPSIRADGGTAYKIMRHSQEFFHALTKGTGEIQTVDIKKTWREAFRWHPDLPNYASLFFYDEENGYFLPLDRSSNVIAGETKICLPFEDFARKNKSFFMTMKAMLRTLESKMGTHADTEFAYEPTENHLELLQSRPLWINRAPAINALTPNEKKGRTILQADRMVTDGTLRNIPVLLFVDSRIYCSTVEKQDIARAVGAVNATLGSTRYILVAPGRVGSSNPELGVPVRYNEIAGVSCIVEVGIAQSGQMPELSYGTHFFSDLETDEVLYMPVFAGEKKNLYDIDWFDETPYTCGPHPAIRIYRGSFSVLMNGNDNFGVVLVR